METNIKRLKAQHETAVHALGATHPLTRQCAAALETEDETVAGAMLDFVSRQGAAEDTRAVAQWKHEELARLRDAVPQFITVVDVRQDVEENTKLRVRATARFELLHTPLRGSARLLLAPANVAGNATPERVISALADHHNRNVGGIWANVHGAGGHAMPFDEVRKLVFAEMRGAR